MRHRPLVLSEEQPRTLGGNPLSAVHLHYLLLAFLRIPTDSHKLFMASDYADNFASLGGIP